VTLCTIHRDSVVMKELCPELSAVMDTVMKSVNCIEIIALKSRFICRIMRYEFLLFHCNSCFLSRGNVACV
jgi:hypothetical protein